MTLHLDGPEAWGAFRSAVATIDETWRLISELPADPRTFGQPGSALAQLWASLPTDACAVDPRLTLHHSVISIGDCLGHIRAGVGRGQPTAPGQVLATTCRTVLLASCRLLLIVGPTDPDTRRANTLAVMRQDSHSLQQYLREAAKFRQLTYWVPPEEMIRIQQRYHENLRQLAPRRTEYDNVSAAAPIVDELIRARGQDFSGLMDALGENLIWTFNVYSGTAHAFGWPALLRPDPPPVPGDFLVALWTTASVALLAVDRLRAAHRRG